MNEEHDDFLLLDQDEIIENEIKYEVDDYFSIDRPCPKCDRFGLEFENHGWERVTYCRLCDYSTSSNLS